MELNRHIGNNRNFEIVPNDYNTNGGLKDSYDVYPNTRASDRFVLIWHCGSAMSYPSTDGSYGWEGMPYDFTHDNRMSTNGYTNPDSGVYVYMGFIWYSPEYLTGTGYSSCNYGDFVTYLYMYLLQYHYTVNEALNAASSASLGYSSFGQSPLYQGMEENSSMGAYMSYFEVYGDGNLCIPS